MCHSMDSIIFSNTEYGCGPTTVSWKPSGPTMKNVGVPVTTLFCASDVLNCTRFWYMHLH